MQKKLKYTFIFFSFLALLGLSPILAAELNLSNSNKLLSLNSSVVVAQTTETPTITVTNTPTHTPSPIPTITPSSSPTPKPTAVPTATVAPTSTSKPIPPAAVNTSITVTPKVQSSPVVLKSIDMNNVSVAGTSVPTTPVMETPTYLDSASQNAALSNSSQGQDGIVTPKSERTTNYGAFLLPAVLLIFVAIVNGVYLVGNYIQNKRFGFLQ